MFRTPGTGAWSSQALRKLLQGGRGKSGYIQVCNKGSRQSEPQRSGIKLRNLAFSAWEDAILIPFICTSAIGPILSHSSCFLHSPSSWAKWCWNPTHTVGSVWGALIHIWRPEITDGCDISCLLIWQEMFSFHKAVQVILKHIDVWELLPYKFRWNSWFTNSKL